MMFSSDSGNAVTPLAEVVTAVSPSYEKCGVCGTTCRPNRSPQLLPCLHTVCKVCIPPADVGETKKECFVCKRPYNILEVTDNPFIEDSSSGPGTHTVTKCAGCEDTAVSGWCVECGEALCSICVSAHQRVRVTRDHTVLSQKMSTGFLPTMFCTMHREEQMKLFCVSCDQLTCRDCQLTYHRNHSYQFLDEAVTAQRAEIESLMVRVRKQQVTVKQSLMDLDGRLLDLEEIKSKMKIKMQKMLICIRYALMKRASELFKNVQDLCDHEAERFTERKKNLRSLQERQEYIVAFTEKALNMENHSALLSCKRQVQSQLKDLLAQHAMPAASMLNVKFQYDQEAYRQIATLGNIVTEEVAFSRPSHLRKASAHPPPATLTPPSSSHSPLTSVSCPSISLSHSAVPSLSMLTSSVSHQSSTSFSSSAPQSSSHCDPDLQPPAPSPPAATSAPLRSHPLTSRPRRNKQTWSFHPYEPKIHKPAAQQNSSEPPQPAGVGSLPSTSSTPSVSEPQSSPVTMFPFPSPALIMLLSPVTPNVLNVSPEQGKAHAAKPTADSSQTIAATGPLEPEPPSMEPEELTDHIQPDKADQLLKAPQCIMPVIAPADSPCERVPPAGSERPHADFDPPATENEPTSTMSETNAPLLQLPGPEIICTEAAPVTHLTSDMDSALSNGISFNISPAASENVLTAKVPANATTDLTHALSPHGTPVPVQSEKLDAIQESHAQAACTHGFNSTLQNQAEITVRCCHQAGHTPAEEHHHLLMEKQHKESEANPRKTDMSSELDLHESNPIQTPVHGLQNVSAHLPTSFRELLEMPSPNLILADSETPDKSPLWDIHQPNSLPQQLLRSQSNPSETELTEEMDDPGSPVEEDPKAPGKTSLLATQQPSTLLELLMRNHPGPSEAELPGQMDEFVPLAEPEKTGDDSDNTTNPNAIVEDSGGPLSRHWLPQVSVLRMPISLPPPGYPLPQFRLLPGATEDEILLQMIEEDSEQFISLDVMSKPEGSSLAHVQELCCAVCQIPGDMTLCEECGRGFHRDCHIPPISSAPSGEWQCTLCRDLSDLRDLYRDERAKRPSLSLLDQRKCEHLLLALMCKKYSTILYEKAELISHYIDITLIRGRLLRKLSPPYRTPSEFVSDIWVLLETLLKNSQETNLVLKMQKYFQKKLRNVFGNALHPSLLKCPDREEDKSVQEADSEVEKVRKTLKRMRQFILANREASGKKVCQEKGTKSKEMGQGNK
ncbi:hypothetical protein AGOR_G00209370 [Albula goreensis]|uniref:Uncharacterized protein n=1 Tax=Albula goreensis TaxID=1534307 RepID=A0A8T3CLM4_9TELE|nr:hypothetical protein AGOR_G00209370 [Albula goreensis]